MARKSFLYYLFSKDKAPLYVDDNRHVLEGAPGSYLLPDGQPARLKQAPDGWRDTLVKYARNTRYWGLFRDFTVPMKFVGDGAKIIRNRMWMAGIEAICYMGILKLDRSSVPYNYTPFYISELDFSKYLEEKSVVTVQAVEGGLTKYLKANESTVYEFPLDGAELEKIAVYLDGLELQNKAWFSVSDGGILDDPYPSYANHIIATDIVQKETEDVGGVFPTFRTKVSNVNADIKATGQYIFKSVLTTTIQVEWNFTITVQYDTPPAINPAAVLKIVLRPIDESGAATTQLELFSRSAADPITGVHTVAGSATLDVNALDECYLYTFLNVEGASGDDQMHINYSGDDPFVKITYVYKHPATYALGIYPYRLFELLCGKMTDNKYTVQSSWLQAKKDIIITCGDALRGLYAPVIKTSFNDFFKAMNIWGIGLTILNDKLIIEPIDYFFTSDTIVDLGEVDDIKIDPAEDISFNVIKTGYPTKEYEGLNGKYEVNQGQQWSAPITRIVRDLDLVSPYRTDAIGIELYRIKFFTKKTTDSSTDNDVFMINIEETPQVIETTVDFFAAGNYMTNPDGYLFASGNVLRITDSANNNFDFPVVAVGTNIVQFDTSVPVTDETGAAITITFLHGGIFNLNRPAYDTVTGLLYPDSAFNIELSPKRTILNNGKFIRSVLDYQDAELIKFRSADKNKDLSTTISGVTITEKEDIQIGGLGDKLFKPYYLTFRTMVPANIIDLINANPFGKVQFTANGFTFYGYLMDGGIAPAKAGKDNDAQTWKLLSAPENDLSKIYNY